MQGEDIKQEHPMDTSDSVIHEADENVELAVSTNVQEPLATPQSPIIQTDNLQPPSESRSACSQSPSEVKEEPISSNNVPPTLPMPNYKHTYTLSGHTMSISCLKYSPDGKILASSGVFACLLPQYAL